jgi:hypothetical protein
MPCAAKSAPAEAEDVSPHHSNLPHSLPVQEPVGQPAHIPGTKSN